MLHVHTLSGHPSSRVPPARYLPGLLAGMVWLALCCSSVSAADAKDEPPPPDDVKLATSDGVTLIATYYPPFLDDDKTGKDAAVLILLHAYKGNRGDLAALARRLQKAGHAVIAPDLRGHGQSTGPHVPLSAADFAAMVRQDLEAVKSFLVDKNDAGELNIERLGVVGVEMGAEVALNWAALDWSWPVLATGKQGQDVKALVLVSPEWSYKGLRINDAVTHPGIQRNLSFLIITGRRNSKLLQEAKRLYSALGRFHATPSPDEAAEKQMLWLKTPPTSLQGQQLMDEESFLADEMILDFVTLRLVNPTLPWRQRK